VISGFSHEVDEKCALLGYYAASSGMTTCCIISPEEHNSQVTGGWRQLYNVMHDLNFSIFISWIRPDGGLKPEPKLVTCKIILMFVVCDRH
jgi:hypothetical protein